MIPYLRPNVTEKSTYQKKLWKMVKMAPSFSFNLWIEKDYTMEYYGENKQ